MFDAVHRHIESWRVAADERRARSDQSVSIEEETQ
jgi:hypothetical protein